MVSVVIETITARYDAASAGSMADDLAGTLTALGRQTHPQDRLDVVVVVDEAVAPAASAEVLVRFPSVRLAESAEENYCAAKNAGAQVARGDVIALLDGDCIPAPDWVEQLVAPMRDPAVDVVAGRTRYEVRSRRAVSLSATDFAHVAADPSGQASGFNINNVAFRRDVLLQHPLDARIRRNGGCTLLYHQLKRAGITMAYQPTAQVSHGDGDISGLHYLRKHFGRGFDSLDVYRLDTDHVLRGSQHVQRWGPLALLPLMVRRTLLDWRRLARHHDDAGVATAAVPLVAVVAALLRLVELAGMMANWSGLGTRRAALGSSSH